MHLNNYVINYKQRVGHNDDISLDTDNDFNNLAFKMVCKSFAEETTDLYCKIRNYHLLHGSICNSLFSSESTCGLFGTRVKCVLSLVRI